MLGFAIIYIKLTINLNDYKSLAACIGEKACNN